MLTNLIDNGIKFRRDGGTVTVQHESGTRDRILVEDNGDGIPAQHLERLFERFYRVDRARSRDMGGTGLGLDRKSTRLNSSHLVSSYAVFCLKNKIKQEILKHSEDTF